MKPQVIAKGMLNLLVRRYFGPFWIRRKWLEKTQRLDWVQMEAVQLDLLRKLVRECYQNISYYHGLMEEIGIKPGDIRSLDDIRRFPILTKQQIVDAGDKILSRKFCRVLLRKAYTGGTTGTPMKVYRSLFSIGNEHAFVRRQFDWAGINMRDRCAYLTGRIIADPNDTKGPLYAFDPFMSELILSSYHLSSQTASTYIGAMKKYKVKAIMGYPSAVYMLAKSCLDNRIGLPLKAVLTSSETLTDSMKETISAAFGCRVFDFYGSAERVCYIFTCESGNYHINPEYGLTELVPVDESDVNRFRVVSTGFWNMAMPLIRYDLGDIVTKSDRICNCGRGFPVVDSIEGREGDIIRTTSGREFGAAILTHLLYGAGHIAESQIIQDAIDHVVIEYVPTENFSQKDLTDFEALIAKHLPNELRIGLKQVKAVQRTSSGKVRPVVSML